MRGRFLGFLASSLLWALPPCATAAPAANFGVGGVPLYATSGAHGYWFYQQPPVKAKPVLMLPATAPARSTAAPGKAKLPACGTAKTWTRQCGFATPDSFAMQAKERHALIHYMVMHPGSKDAVLNVQKYTKWVVDQALYAGNVWNFNMVNHPSLTPKSTSPISEYGLRMAMDWTSFDKQAAWQAISKFHGQLVLFTKQNCDFCHAQIVPLMWFKEATHLPIWDASLQGRCSGWFGKYCVPPAESIKPAEILHVRIVPSLYLHLPGKVWIRVSAGLTTGATLESRLYNFFLSWRLGVQKHLQSTFHGLPMDLNPNQTPATSHQVLSVLFGGDDQTGADAVGR